MPGTKKAANFGVLRQFVSIGLQVLTLFEIASLAFGEIANSGFCILPRSQYVSFPIFSRKDAAARRK